MPESTHVEPDYFLLSDFRLEQNDSVPEETSLSISGKSNCPVT